MYGCEIVLQKLTKIVKVLLA